MFIPALTYSVSKILGFDYASNVATFAFLLECYIPFLSFNFDEEVPKYITKLNSFLSLIRQSPPEELRNSIAAVKIKKGVVPHLINRYPEKFSETNPKIGIVYGATHTGIVECLKNDKRSRFSIALHKNYGMKLVDSEHMNYFSEIKLLNHLPVLKRKHYINTAEASKLLN